MGSVATHDEIGFGLGRVNVSALLIASRLTKTPSIVGLLDRFCFPGKRQGSRQRLPPSWLSPSPLVRKGDLPPGVPGGGGTMRAQWANWKKLSPVFSSKDLIWTDALPRVVVCWRPSSRISPGPVPRIDKLWSRY